MMEKKTLVPKLRFPEFLGAENWREKYIENFFNVGSSKRVLQQNWTTQGIPFYRTRELVSLSKSEPFSSEIFISKSLFEEITQKYGAPREGDFLVSGVGTLGISYLVKNGDEFYFKDGNVIWFSRKGGIISLFFKYCFESDAIQNQILKQASVSTVGTYTIQNAKTTKFYCPSTEKEQQKIAECLSSVDELIAAQTRKVDALKIHKKGLMQQLFPREGETQSRLRFSEFQGTGEWDETKLGNHARIQSGYSPSGFTLSSKGQYAFVKVEDLNNCAKYQLTGREFCNNSDGVVPSNSILFPKRGAAIELNKIRITATEILIDTNLMALTPKDGLTSEFLYYYLSNVGLSHIADTSTIPQINNKHIVPFDLLLPKETEQQRIASCLSSLDTLIILEAQKLEALKIHKKGLMQQLFPSPEEVEA